MLVKFVEVKSVVQSLLATPSPPAVVKAAAEVELASKEEVILTCPVVKSAVLALSVRLFAVVTDPAMVGTMADVPKYIVLGLVAPLAPMSKVLSVKRRLPVKVPPPIGSEEEFAALSPVFVPLAVPPPVTKVPVVAGKVKQYLFQLWHLVVRLRHQKLSQRILLFLELMYWFQELHHLLKFVLEK